MKRAVFGPARCRPWDDCSGPTCCLSRPARIYSHEKTPEVKLESVIATQVLSPEEHVSPLPPGSAAKEKERYSDD